MEAEPGRKTIPPPGTALAALLLGGLVVLVFAPSLRFGFVYDDRWTLLDNPVIRAPGNLRLLLGAELTRAGIPDASRPVMLASEIFDWALWRARPMGYHLQNLLWHGGVVWLLFVNLRRWGFTAWLALAAAALFAVHPLVVEPVAAINYREDLLAGFFVLLALWLIGAGGGRVVALAAAALALWLGALAKENALVAPLLLLAVALVLPGKLPRPRLAVFSLALPAAAAFAWRWWAVGGAAVVSRTAEIPIQHRQALWVLPRAGWAFLQGIGQFLLPARLAPEYPDPAATPLTTVVGWAAILVIATLTAGAIRFRRKVPGASLGWLWAVLAYLPHFGWVPLTNLRADRYLYLPALGLALATVALLAALAQRLGATAVRARTLAAAGLILAGLGLRSWRQERIWRDDVALFTAATAADPGSQRAWVGLAGAQLRRGQSLSALEAADQALALADAPRAREMRGLVWLAQGDAARARLDLEQALRTADPAHRPQVLNNLGLAEKSAGDLPAARGHLALAVQLAPRFDRPALQLAQIAFEAGDIAQARSQLIQLLARVPESQDGWQLLARVEQQAGNRAAAEAAAGQAAALGGR